MKLSVNIMVLVITLMMAIPSYHAYVIPSQSRAAMARQTPTKSSAIVQKHENLAKPTTPPTHHRLMARDLQQTLSLYVNWQSVCNGGGNQAQVSIGNPSLKNLWQTVTQTVNCGRGSTVTVTETISNMATTTTTVSGSQSTYIPVCDDACWSGYLWHTYGYGISVAQAFTGIVCILIGIYFMVFGYRSFRLTLAFTGFVFFATMTWIGLTNNEPANGYPNTDILYVCVSAGLGLVGAVLCAFLYGASIYLIGGLGGFFFAVWILSWKASLVISVKVAYICFIVGIGVVGAGLVYLLETYVLILATSFTGAYLTIFGLDFFAHTGLLNSWLYIFDANPNHFNAYMIQKTVLVMLSFIGVFFLASAGWQYFWNIIKHNRKTGVNMEPKQEEEGK
ncbi:hypothetical protein DM01DRAFT_1308229 [Hesseltinella vesiculosa]|uniref:Transmembrane protein 198 n=1 Tax=Hesseltinella vesiculosa TaxID=101127 RepID=A0A1X2GCA6_9FUNG|nr:hypothetical protein DM01DRAFT_1308229 [Hesseltinella vesiculosa]